MTNDEPESRAGVSPAQSARPTTERSARSRLRARWAGGTPALRSWIALACTLSVSTCGESGPSTDRADFTVWPNQASRELARKQERNSYCIREPLQIEA